MCRISETEISIWQPNAETQLEAARRPGMDLEIWPAEQPARDAAIPAGAYTSKNVTAVAIPIKWISVESWPKAIRSAKSFQP